MTKLDDLKTDISNTKGSGSYFPYSVKFSTLETLIETAEVAFEFSDLWECDLYGTYKSNGTVGDFKRVHNRIQELKKELTGE